MKTSHTSGYATQNKEEVNYDYEEANFLDQVNIPPPLPNPLRREYVNLVLSSNFQLIRIEHFTGSAYQI